MLSESLRLRGRVQLESEASAESVRQLIMLRWSRLGPKSLIVQDPRSVDMVRGGLNPLLLASLDTLLNVGAVVAIPWTPLGRRHGGLKVSQIRKICQFGCL